METQIEPKPDENKGEFELENVASVDRDDNKNFLVLAPQDVTKALEKVRALTSVIDGAVRLALQRTNSSDWINMGGKWYLQATGVEKVRGLFGLYFRDRSIIREDYPDKSYAYICVGVAGSKFLDALYGETTIEIEGSRSSKDPFFAKQKNGVDPMDVRKAAYANFQVRAAKALLGLGNYTTADLTAMGVKVSDSAGVQYGNSGTFPKSAQNQKPGCISEAQCKRLYAIAKGAGKTDADVKMYLKKCYQLDSASDIKSGDEYRAVCQFFLDQQGEA